MGADALIDKLAADITARRLKPGDRLPPQRTFAFEHGIAASTASRVYGELLRRGLVVGEVGRGTFVAGGPVPTAPHGEPVDERIDLEFNFPTVPEQIGLIGTSVTALQRSESFTHALGPVTQRTLATARDVTAAFFDRPEWRPDPKGFVFTGSGRQSLAAAISALVPVGGRLAVEAVTYPLVRSIAGRLGVGLVPITVDNNGALPAALAKAHRATPFAAFYVQPILHNPLGHTMPPARLAEVATVAGDLDVLLIEDRVYGFLGDAPPLAALAPGRTIVIESLSKRLAPGASVGVLHAPLAMRDRIAVSVRAGAWSVSPFALQVGMRLMADGTAANIVALKRKDAVARQAIVASGLSGATFLADPKSYHVWLELPEGWRAEAFAAAATRIGIALTPASAFAMTAGHAPNAVRLALGRPSHDDLRIAMTRLARLLASQPDDAERTE